MNKNYRQYELHGSCATAKAIPLVRIEKMVNFRFGLYLIVVAVLQFITILLYGYTKEGGDINAASMYPVAYLLSAVVYSFFSGLLFINISEPKKFGGRLLLLLVPALLAVVLNVATSTLGKGLYYVIIAAALLINGVYYYIVQKYRSTTSTDKT
ncbi:hypothetical protein [Pontibacter mangrovi]|uniref:Uncharacterized protein n=1 Tax=Pontibacter mangrovi TaxID=2589816 RepID=A0A501W7R2_9BACT|nr:hypothetical protein [Pontibacter mangrovi]TPE43291.1 hypothetical protein FJM65_14365 [Pontibacter mangrovi]